VRGIVPALSSSVHVSQRLFEVDAVSLASGLNYKGFRFVALLESLIIQLEFRPSPASGLVQRGSFDCDRMLFILAVDESNRTDGRAFNSRQIQWGACVLRSWEPRRLDLMRVELGRGF
jgi:hypothetical protein